jgi:hypothetical protein
MTSSHPLPVPCQWFAQLASALYRRSAPRIALLSSRRSAGPTSPAVPSAAGDVHSMSPRLRTMIDGKATSRGPAHRRFRPDASRDTILRIAQP